MKKGTLSHWFHVFIEVVILLLVIFLFYGTAKAFSDHFTSSMGVGASARDIAAAINEVSECIDEQGSGSMDCLNGVEVRVNLDQDLPWGHNGDGRDPMWIIQHDTCVNGGLLEDGVTKCNPNEVSAACEIGNWWDSSDRMPKCEHSLCWGLLENTEPGRELMGKGALEKLEPFYMIDPCYGTVVVREKKDGDGNPTGKIEVCFKEADESIRDRYNYCYGEHGCSWETGDSNWPEKSGVWEYDYGNRC